METAVRLPAERLERWVADLLAGAGLEREAASTVAATLVDASLRGVDSHGVARTPIYVERLLAGGVNGRPQPRIEREQGALALMDGDAGPGQVAGVRATDHSIALAQRYGAGVVAVRNSNHYGAAGYYAIRAARAGLIGISTTNSDPLVIPFGGRDPALGTNPIAFAAPLPGGEVMCLDMATSQVAMNKVFNARDDGRPIPEGWGVDAEGRTTTDPAAVAAGVPLGGYKGYGLAVMVEVLSGVLTGAGVAHSVGQLYGDRSTVQDVGSFHLAIDPAPLIGTDVFAERLAGLLAGLSAIPPAPGHDEVLVP
ncbi:MAG TPA: Ldh family oxidoreductase, partial [Solirubrobacteraceae bacterium]|nr:Ldh family oxidoreductase [Solirubrobacteraceae bacterium]